MLLFTSFKPPLQRVQQQALELLRRINLLFIGSVLVPFGLAVAYYGFIASDIYISESRFVVRSNHPQQSASGSLSSLLGGMGMSRAQDEAYTVHDFILSRDALARLDQQLGVRKAFSAGSIDFLSRFPGLDQNDSFEELYRYYGKRVGVTYDTASAIMTVRVSAFAAQDSLRINEELIAMSERLVNELNKRALEDSLRFAVAGMEDAERKAKASALALSAFRTRSSVFDPERQSTMQLQGVAKLQEELIATKTQLIQVRGLSANNPQVSVLEQRVDALQKAIDAEMRKVAGGGVSLTTAASEYERLALERGFAEKQLASALASLEMARGEAQKKQLYLERIAQPSLPDYPMEPRRIRAILNVLVLGLIAWGIIALLTSSIREHLD